MYNSAQTIFEAILHWRQNAKARSKPCTALWCECLGGGGPAAQHSTALLDDPNPKRCQDTEKVGFGTAGRSLVWALLGSGHWLALLSVAQWAPTSWALAGAEPAMVTLTMKELVRAICKAGRQVGA